MDRSINYLSLEEDRWSNSLLPMHRSRYRSRMLLPRSTIVRRRQQRKYHHPSRLPQHQASRRCSSLHETTHRSYQRTVQSTHAYLARSSTSPDHRKGTRSRRRSLHETGSPRPQRSLDVRHLQLGNLGKRVDVQHLRTSRLSNLFPGIENAREAGRRGERYSDDSGGESTEEEVYCEEARGERDSWRRSPLVSIRPDDETRQERSRSTSSRPLQMEDHSCYRSL